MDLIGVLIILIALPYIYADDNSNCRFLYTALGDSLAAGVAAFGKQGYVYRYHNWLNINKYDRSLKLYNSGVLGLTSAGLMGNLYNNPRLQEAVRKSSVVTLDIGANDIIKARYNTEMLRRSADAFEVNFNNILQTIRTFNTQGQLYVMDIYNPYPQGAQLHDLTEEWVGRFNNTIYSACKNKSYNVNGVAAVYEAFKGNELQYTLIGSGNRHPNSLGHAVISQCFERITL